LSFVYAGFLNLPEKWAVKVKLTNALGIAARLARVVVL
jgi:hypothetical protein